MHILMGSLFVYVDVGPLLPPSSQRWVVAIVELEVPTGNPRRLRHKLETIMPHLEQLAEGIADVVWQHLDNELIATCHSVPPEWTPLMRRIAVYYEYVRREARGDVAMEDDESFDEDDDSSKEDDETEPDDGDDSGSK